MRRAAGSVACGTSPSSGVGSVCVDAARATGNAGDGPLVRVTGASVKGDSASSSVLAWRSDEYCQPRASAPKSTTAATPAKTCWRFCAARRRVSRARRPSSARPVSRAGRKARSAGSRSLPSGSAVGGRSEPGYRTSSARMRRTPPSRRVPVLGLRGGVTTRARLVGSMHEDLVEQTRFLAAERPSSTQYSRAEELVDDCMKR